MAKTAKKVIRKRREKKNVEKGAVHNFIMKAPAMKDGDAFH